ncbi:acylneuraminate cytidylyltransferase family protein [Pseudotabrizicola sediminis]|uniref:Acylneuraminate cytidylyltransferase family protein n=1 Tax=Pseudotabrizicola sediminis TaxID=2486418 RepID=A0ABY2KI91_9RHOB|nr:acylneuraminate cytidylyltransferase family protein [Pseudotabrizicola sediminis]TGD42051.1 acylneuraminate cytidylyltransferase family protein [Pseudotabrizicola sediminis]
MILGHIGARKGSKGVPGKNFRTLCGKPLIDWSLDQLFANPRVGAVVVSTDDPAIHAHAVARGALDIGLRPAELATDTAPKWGVWQHALSASEQICGPVSAFLDLDCTSPLRIPEDIDGALDTFAQQAPDMVMSVCEARKNPYFNLVEPDATGALQVSKPLPGGVWARQDAPVVYEHVGVVYVVAPDYLRRAKTIYEGRVVPFVLPSDRCHDIDTPYDFQLVEFLLTEQLNAGVRKV